MHFQQFSRGNFIIHNYTSNAILGVWAQIDKLIIPSILYSTKFLKTPSSKVVPPIILKSFKYKVLKSRLIIGPAIAPEVAYLPPHFNKFK